jgi:glycyl-tRNA synthetase beta chain
MAELLLELLSEEIPARMQARAADDLQRLVCDGLAKAQLGFTQVQAYVTPRRLALHVEGLPARQPDVREERKGPRVGAAEKAVDGFLRSAGLSGIDAAEVRDTDKGPFYFAVIERPGRPAADVIAEVVAAVMAAFPWPKSMRWSDGRLRWVRPLHSILGLLDGEPIPLTIAQGGAGPPLLAGRDTEGHRFLAAGRFSVAGFADYAEQLAQGHVILDQRQRRARIEAGVERLAAAEGLTVRDDPALLDEVTGLVEWPVALIGRIDERFMDVPSEVLITAMRSHQKYFALLRPDGALAPRFIAVANTETVDGGAAVIAGNERVLRARLADAKFFWNQDRAKPLASRVPKLAERVFHAKLGSDLQRTGRLEALARHLAPACGADPDLAARAACLCKADLMTGMVGEFPELQGIMGRYYALHDGEAPDVADAIAEHYAPKGPSDRCPQAPVSVAVALADKIDTLVGFFAIGEKPTGSGDPYALRRAALGVIRLIVENKLRLPLRPAFARGQELFGTLVGSADRHRLTAELLAFFADRLKVHLREQGVRHDLITAVVADGAEDDLLRLLARVAALKDFLDTDDGANLLVAFRRAANIVRIEEKRDGKTVDGETDPSVFVQDEETGLHRSLQSACSGIAEALAAERFADAMACVAALRGPVDAFFDHVTVNSDDPVQRTNRLRLLSQIRSALSGVADFSQVEG